MRLNTIERRKARGGFEQAWGEEELVNRMYQIIKRGKEGLDGFVQELGVMLVEAIMDMEREERSGPQYQPVQAGVYKWAYQKRSLYLGDRKISVRHPRLRGPSLYGSIGHFPFALVDGREGHCAGGSLMQAQVKIPLTSTA